MSAKDQNLNVFSLNIAVNLLAKNNKIESFKTAELSFISTAFNLYLLYNNEVNQNEPDPSAKELKGFVKLSPINDLHNISEFLQRSGQETKNSSPQKKEKNTEQVSEPLKEDSSVPAELETMVALYKEHQSEVLNEKPRNSVSETIKRARKSWEEKRKIELIYQNAEGENKEIADKRQKDRDNYFHRAVDTKSQTVDEITQNTKKLISYSLLSNVASKNLSTAEIAEAIDEIAYLAETGAIDINIHDFKQLNIAVELTLKNHLKNYKSEFDHIDSLIEQKNKLEIENPYSAEADNLEEKIGFADEELSQNINSSTKNFVQNLASTYSDYDDLVGLSKKEVATVINGLSKAIPNASLKTISSPLLDKYQNELEKALNQDSKKFSNLGINQYAESIGARVIGINQEIKSKNLSNTALELYSRGLTPEKLKKLEQLGNSDFVSLLKKNPTLEKAVRNSITKINASKLGEEIKNNFPKLPENFQRFSGAIKTITDPYQASKAYIYKQIGKSIGKALVQDTSSFVAQQLGNYIVKNGLREGVSVFAKEAAVKGLTKAAIWAATKVGISLSAESLNAIVPGLGLVVDIVIQAAIWIAEKTVKWGYDKFKELYKDIWGEDFEFKKFAKEAGIAAVAVGSSLIVIPKVLKGFSVATKAAVVSAAGIVWLSLATIAIFLSLTFMVAPLLSTLVQFDSEEKVKYTPNGVSEESNNSECGWPVTGSYQITQGPEGTATHGTNKLQAIDIFSSDINGKPVISSTNGKVIFTGVSGSYGNAVYIETTNSAGKFQVLYAHLSSISAPSPGSEVKKGQIIGYVGNSGGWKDPHLHFEYKGIDYNQCPAGGVKIKVGCSTFQDCGGIMTGAINTIN